MLTKPFSEKTSHRVQKLATRHLCPMTMDTLARKKTGTLRKSFVSVSPLQTDCITRSFIDGLPDALTVIA